jgi:hypothetical protein
MVVHRHEAPGVTLRFGTEQSGGRILPRSKKRRWHG